MWLNHSIYKFRSFAIECHFDALFEQIVFESTVTVSQSQHKQWITVCFYFPTRLQYFHINVYNFAIQLSAHSQHSLDSHSYELWTNSNKKQLEILFLILLKCIVKWLLLIYSKMFVDLHLNHIWVHHFSLKRDFFCCCKNQSIKVQIISFSTFDYNVVRDKMAKCPF